MPMATNEEHGAQNPDNPYCIHCTDIKGKLLPFERKFEEMVKQVNKNAEFVTYPGAGHAFFADYRPSYNAAAAADA